MMQCDRSFVWSLALQILPEANDVKRGHCMCRHVDLMEESWMASWVYIQCSSRCVLMLLTGSISLPLFYLKCWSTKVSGEMINQPVLSFLEKCFFSISHMSLGHCWVARRHHGNNLNTSSLEPWMLVMALFIEGTWLVYTYGYQPKLMSRLHITSYDLAWFVFDSH